MHKKTQTIHIQTFLLFKMHIFQLQFIRQAALKSRLIIWIDRCDWLTWKIDILIINLQEWHKDMQISEVAFYWLLTTLKEKAIQFITRWYTLKLELAHALCVWHIKTLTQLLVIFIFKPCTYKFIFISIVLGLWKFYMNYMAQHFTA